MAISQVNTSVYTCDNLKCKNQRLVIDNQEPEGFKGPVTWTMRTGQVSTGEWWACSARCIGPAVKTSLDLLSD